MAIVSHVYDYVVGVDTHARNHVYAIITSTGEVVQTAGFPTTKAGLARALEWARRRTGSGAVLWVIEGAAAYGALLAAQVVAAGGLVVEAARMNSRAHRVLAKTDELDAIRIALAVLPLDEAQLRYPRAGEGERQALQILVTARDQMSADRTRSVNALTALLRSTDLDVDARHRLANKQITAISRWRNRSEGVALATTRREAVRLANQIITLDGQLKANKSELDRIVKTTPAKELLDEPGFGPYTAAVVYAAWSHPGRLQSAAAFARLAGVCPIPASSGNTQRHRLNRGGDRRLNKALHIVALTRMTHDDQTRSYLAKRTIEGKSSKEIRRCLKRYIARHAYRTLNAAATSLPA